MNDEEAVITAATRIVDAALARELARRARQTKGSRIHFTTTKGCIVRDHSRDCPGHSVCGAGYGDRPHVRVSRDPIDVTCRRCLKRIAQYGVERA